MKDRAKGPYEAIGDVFRVGYVRAIAPNAVLDSAGGRRVGKDAHDKARTEILSGLCVCLRNLGRGKHPRLS